MPNGDKIREVFKENIDFARDMANIYISHEKFDDAQYWLTRVDAMEAILLSLERRGLLD